MKMIRGAITFAALFAVLLLFPVLCPARSVIIEGRVFTEHGPLPGAKVSVYRTQQEVFANTPFMVSEPADIQGVYSLHLEQGEYYFVARGNDRGRVFFAYHGGNPLRIGAQNAWIGLMALAEKPPVYSDGKTGVQGVVTYKGKPVPGANIAFYSLKNAIFKGLGFLAGKGVGFMETVGRDGTFNFSLKPNTYVVIARKPGQGRDISRLRKGELFCYYPASPIEIRPGKLLSIEVPCYPKADRLAFVGTPKIKANDYPTVEELNESGGYGIKGRVRDIGGNPVAGVYVIAYRVDAPSLIHESKDVAVTGADGEYFVRLQAAGSYGLVARSTLGRAPEPDDLTGLHNKNPWQGIAFQAGQVIENIDIVLRHASGGDGGGRE